MRKPTPFTDDRIVAEIDALLAYLDAKPDRRLAMYAMGARQALQWVRDNRQPDPMNPARMISLLDYALDWPRVIPFTIPKEGESDV